jgi:RimJ/RimL family protein N-acetyltransferase
VPRHLPATALRSERLDLEPLTVAHAEEMVAVLADPALYTVIGGEPPTLDELRERYQRQSRGPADGNETWLNWVVRDRASGAAAGYVQATVSPAGADLAWLIGAGHQGAGLASEAAAAMVGWLAASGVQVLSAYVAPGHVASERVAHRIGLRRTDEVVDGEVHWVGAVTRAR